MRYLIAGANGMLGHDLVAALAGRNFVALSRAELDVTDARAVTDAVGGVDVVLNASAYTRVDAAEDDEDAAYAVNATGAANLAAAAAAAHATLVQFSTDYVFDGDATTPYAETAARDPKSAYGRTKAEGERLALERNPDRTIIIRGAWLYGASGPNFAATMLRLAGARDTINVVADQVGQPTWTADLAGQTVALLDAGVTSGVFHGTNSGQASWFDFARAVFEVQGLDPERIQPIASHEYPQRAPRPAYSVLGHSAWSEAGLSPMRDWRRALEAAGSAGVFGTEPTHRD